MTIAHRSVSRSGERLGLTVSSFSSLSLEPPLILFSINRHARSFPARETAEHLAVNVLAEHQGALSTRFARALIDKWVDLDVGGDQYGSPTLPGALAVPSCSTHQRFDGRSHDPGRPRRCVGGIESLGPAPADPFRRRLPSARLGICNSDAGRGRRTPARMVTGGVLPRQLPGCACLCLISR